MLFLSTTIVHNWANSLFYSKHDHDEYDTEFKVQNQKFDFLFIFYRDLEPIGLIRLIKRKIERESP